MLTYLLQKLQPRPTQSGFTIIESLLAVLLIAIVLVGIGPIIAFSTATRIQSRRVELGIQSARGYISGVQSGTITPPPIAETATNPVALALKDVAAPNASALTCNANSYCTAPAPTATSSLYCFDQDGDGQCTAISQRDLIVQGFGLQAPLGLTTTPTTAERQKAGYQLGIRIYRANAFGANLTLLTSNSPTQGRVENKASIVTSGIGSRTLPIVEMTTEIVQSGGGGTSLTDLCKRINRTQSGACN